jgi:arylformamidase
MPVSFSRLIDISLPLDDRFQMHTPAGFARDLQFQLEVLKDYDSPGGAGQIVRGAHMRLHAGTHVDAQAHFVKGGTHVHELPLETFIGEAVVADLSATPPDTGISVADLERTVGAELRRGDRLLVRTDWNKRYGQPGWLEGSPYLEPAAVDWCIQRGAVLVGIDFAHAKDAPNSPSKYYLSRALCEHNVLVMAYLQNLDQVTRQRVTLLCLPLKMIGVESAPVRAVVLED